MCDCCELTDESKEFVESVERLVEAKRDIEEAVEAGECSGEAAEKRWRQAVAKLERAGMADILEAADIDAETIWIGEDEYYRVDSASGTKTYRAMAGEVAVERTVYRKSGEHNAPLVCPLELRWGMVEGGWTPRAARAMSHVGQQMPYEKARETACEMGCLPYGSSSFERMTRRVGERLDECMDAIDEAVAGACECIDEADCIAVSVDRVAVAFDEAEPAGWRDARQACGEMHYRMAWCATVALCDASGEPIWTRRYGQTPTDDARHRLGERLQRDVRRLRNRDDTLDVIALSDGARELGEMLDHYIVEPAFSGDAVRLVDAWHLFSYLASALEAHYGPDSEEVDRQMAAWRLELMNEPEFIDIIRLQMRLWDDRDTVVDGDKPIEQALKYIDNHREQMNYARHRTRGRPVGTGHVEATCKSVVQLRMKRNGQYWKQQGAQAVMQLRSLALSDGWEAGIERLLETYQTDDAIYARKRVA